MEAQSGWAAPQSAQNLLGATAQMRSATSEVDRASAMAPRMASSHCSFSSSDSAEKLRTQEWGEGGYWERAQKDLRQHEGACGENKVLRAHSQKGRHLGSVGKVGVDKGKDTTNLRDIWELGRAQREFCPA